RSDSMVGNDLFVIGDNDGDLGFGADTVVLWSILKFVGDNKWDVLGFAGLGKLAYRCRRSVFAITQHVDECSQLLAFVSGDLFIQLLYQCDYLGIGATSEDHHLWAIAVFAAVAQVLAVVDAVIFRTSRL